MGFPSLTLPGPVKPGFGMARSKTNTPFSIRSGVFTPEALWRMYDSSSSNTTLCLVLTPFPMLYSGLVTLASWTLSFLWFPLASRPFNVFWPSF